MNNGLRKNMEQAAERIDQLAQAQHTDERLNVLIDDFQHHLEENGKRE